MTNGRDAKVLMTRPGAHYIWKKKPTLFNIDPDDRIENKMFIIEVLSELIIEIWLKWFVQQTVWFLCRFRVASYCWKIISVWRNYNVNMFTECLSLDLLLARRHIFFSLPISNIQISMACRCCEMHACKCVRICVCVPVCLSTSVLDVLVTKSTLPWGFAGKQFNEYNVRFN